jgi:hypothetical protein
MSPGAYLTYTVLLAVIAIVLLYSGTWGLAAVAETHGWQPGDEAFQTLRNAGLAVVGAFVLWSGVAMAVKRARDAHIPTLTFKAGLPALVLFDHFGLARLTDERLVGPLSGLTPIAALAFAGVFLLLLLAPRAPIQPLHPEGLDAAGSFG